MTSQLFIAPTRIGDAVLATSLLRHVLETSPDARVTIATSPFAAPIYEGYPQLERLITIEKQSYSRHWLFLAKQTIHTRWDAVWDLRNSILSRVLMAKNRHIFVSPKTEEPKVLQFQRALRLDRLAYPMLWPKAEDVAQALLLAPSTERYLVFAPIANWPPKEWPLGHYIALAHQLLSDTHQGFRPIIVCAGHERERALPMLQALAPYHPMDLTQGSAHLLTIFSIMQRAAGFVGNDSGLMHMAAAAGIPTLGLFGPTPAMIYQPWGPKAAFLNAPDGSLANLSVATVAEAFLKRIRS